jgi:DNA-binding IscR family transcriptional regulator
LKKIVRKLRGEHLIISKEGSSGGYTLSRHPRTISVWQIFHAIHTSQKHGEQPVNFEPCPLIESCLPQQINKTIQKTLEMSFQRISVSELIKE